MAKQNTILILIFFSVAFVACKKENNTPTTVLNEMTDSTAILKYAGNFSSWPMALLAEM
ncbi:MAG: hypothetical protein QM737_01845 [Ferruginibacter sp.]